MYDADESVRRQHPHQRPWLGTRESRRPAARNALTAGRCRRCSNTRAGAHRTTREVRPEGDSSGIRGDWGRVLHGPRLDVGLRYEPAGRLSAPEQRAVDEALVLILDRTRSVPGCRCRSLATGVRCRGSWRAGVWAARTLVGRWRAHAPPDSDQRDVRSLYRAVLATRARRWRAGVWSFLCTFAGAVLRSSTT